MSNILETVIGASANGSIDELELRLDTSINFAVNYRLRGIYMDKPVDSLVGCYSIFLTAAKSVILDLIMDGQYEISFATPVDAIHQLEKAIAYQMYVVFDERVGTLIRSGYFKGKQ